MQTFSNMQRNITYQRDLKYFFLLIVVLVYEAISTIYSYLPPLFGFMFVIFLNSLKDDSKFLVFTTIIYLLFFEANRDFLIFSSILFFVISIYYIEPILKKIIKCNKCLIPILITWIYMGYSVFINASYFILSIEEPVFNFLIFYYIIIETLFAFLVLG